MTKLYYTDSEGKVHDVTAPETGQLFARINTLETEILDLRRVLTKAQEIFATSTDSYYATKIVSKMIEEKLRLTTATPQEPST